MTRTQLLRLGLAIVILDIGLVVAGLQDWDRWIQLVAMAAVLISATRLFAPEFFGWTDPED